MRNGLRALALLGTSLPTLASATPDLDGTVSDESGPRFGVFAGGGYGSLGPTIGMRTAVGLSSSFAIDSGIQLSLLVTSVDAGGRLYLQDGDVAPYVFARGGYAHFAMWVPFVNEWFTGNLGYVSPGLGLEYRTGSSLALAFEVSMWQPLVEDGGPGLFGTIAIGVGGRRHRAPPSERTPRNAEQADDLSDIVTSGQSSTYSTDEPPPVGREAERRPDDIRCLGGFPTVPNSGTCPRGLLCRNRVCVPAPAPAK